LDSDGDSIPDSVEAGDDDWRTPARDSDEDGIPDFQEIDSDGGGVEDGVELRRDTDPTDPLDDFLGRIDGDVSGDGYLCTVSPLDRHRDRGLYWLALLLMWGVRRDRSRLRIV
jgi:hypothetical protein